MQAKVCTSCSEPKPLAAFGRDRGRLRAKCKECANAQTQAWREKTPEEFKQKNKAYSKNYNERNPEKRSALNAQRHVRLRSNRATPAWANRDAILAVYAQARLLRQMGQDVQVDHIIPLNGKDVCGLHVENNIRIVLRSENLLKANKMKEGSNGWPA